MTQEKTILVVDDDKDFLFQQRIQLESAGFRVLEANSHEKARQLLERATFDLALVDLMMEEMDAGFVLCREIKQKRPGVPVIMITAVARETGIRFGAPGEDGGAWIQADAVLAKPVRFEQLTREIGRLLKG